MQQEILSGFKKPPPFYLTDAALYSNNTSIFLGSDKWTLHIYKAIGLYNFECKLDLGKDTHLQ